MILARVDTSQNTNSTQLLAYKDVDLPVKKLFQHTHTTPRPFRRLGNTNERPMELDGE
jgi:hypothetical protein